MYRLTDRAENHTRFFELFTEGGHHRHGVKHHVYRHARQHLLLVDRDAQLFVGAQQLGIDLIQALGPIFHTLGLGEVRQRLEVDLGVMYVGPIGLFHLLPGTEGLQAPVEHPLGLTFFRGDKPDDVFIQTGRQGIRIDLGMEAGGVLALDQFFNFLLCHHFTSVSAFGVS